MPEGRERQDSETWVETRVRESWGEAKGKEKESRGGVSVKVEVAIGRERDAVY